MTLALSRNQGERIAVYHVEPGIKRRDLYRREHKREPDFFMSPEKIDREKFQAEIKVGEFTRTLAINCGNTFYISQEGGFTDKNNSAFSFLLEKVNPSWSKGVQFSFTTPDEYIFLREEIMPK